MKDYFEKLFKFRAGNDDDLNALKGAYLWFSPYSALNDPFEGVVARELIESGTQEELEFLESVGVYAVTAARGISDTDALRIVKSKRSRDGEVFFRRLRGNVDEHFQSAHDYMQSAYVCSMSGYAREEEVEEQYANILMWSHYADGLKGFCLKFNKKKLEQSLKALNVGAKLTHNPIKYDVDVHKVDQRSYKSALVEYMKALYVKHPSWAYEAEYRYTSRAYGEHKFAADALEEIFIGGKAGDIESEILAIRDSLYPHAKVVRIEAMPDSFNLQRVSLRE